MLAELEIVNSLFLGLDPRTGLKLDTPASAKVGKARQRLLEVLIDLDKKIAQATNSSGKARKPKANPSNHHAIWHQPEIDQLSDQWNNGASVDSISKNLGRTPLSVSTRLVKLGFASDRYIIKQINIERGGVYGRIQEASKS